MATATEKQAAVDLLVAEGVIERTDDGEILTEAQVDKAMAVDNWISDLGDFDDAAIVVYQVEPNSNNMEYIESMGVQEMTGPMLFEKLKNVYGGGKFKIQMRADGAIRKTQTVLIKKVPIKEKDPALGGLDLPSLVRELKSGKENNSTELILNMMKEQNSQFQTMITTLVGAMGNNNNAPVVDPVAMQASLLDGIQKMQHLAGLDKKEKSPTELIMEGVKLVGAIKEGGEGGEANIYSLLSKAVDGFGDTLGAAMRMPPGMGMPSVPQGGPPQSVAQPGSPLQAIANESKKEPEKQPVLGQPTLEAGHPLAPFEPFVDWMLSLAHKNANPELYAEVIIDQIGMEMAQAWLATDEGIIALKENLPKTVPYENWLRSVGQEIVLIAEESPAGDDQGPQGDVDGPAPTGENAGELIAPDGDVRTGHDSLGPATITIDQPSVDGDTERPGGDTSNTSDHGESGESSQDNAANP